MGEEGTTASGGGCGRGGTEQAGWQAGMLCFPSTRCQAVHPAWLSCCLGAAMLAQAHWHFARA